MANVRLLSLAVYAVLVCTGKAQTGQEEQLPTQPGRGDRVPVFQTDPRSRSKGTEFLGVKSDICTDEERARCPEYRQLEYLLAKGCKPVYKSKKCCAVKFKCIKNFQKKLKGRCYAFGRFYKKGEDVPSIDIRSCQDSCVCKENSFIKCFTKDCARPNFGDGRYTIFRLDDCCPRTQLLTDSTPVCKYGDDEVYEGQFLNFSDIRLPDTCQECICSSSYSGPFGPGCQRKRCGYLNHKGTPIYSGCIPIFSGNTCCELQDYLCPTSDLIIRNQGSKRGNKKKCRFGNIFIRKGKRLRLTDPNIRCECLTPPELRCSRVS